MTLRLSRSALKTSSVSSLVLFGSLFGCKPDAATKSAENGTQVAPASSTSISATAKPVAAPAGSETITGTISFTGKQPAKVLIDTGMDPACSLAGGEVYAEQYAVTNGKLANVFVYLKSGPPAAMQAGPTSTQAVILDQKGCRYTPHVIGVMQGGSVEFRNSDPTMHNIHTMPTIAGNDTLDFSEGPRATPQTRRFSKPELMMPVRCNNHPWMNAFINVSETPFFAVSDAAGHFEIHGLPPGDYVIGAVHEKLGEQTLQLAVAPNKPAHADLKFAAK